MEVLKNLNRAELKEFLRWLKLYSELTTKLGYRGRNIFLKTLSWEKSYKVEFFPALTQDVAWEKALQVFEKIFWVKPKKEDVVFQSKESLLWWIRVFEDDYLVDLSLKKAVKELSA